MIWKECEYCKSGFFAKNWNVNHDGGKYCSRSCLQRSRKGDRAGGWKGGKIKRICEICGSSFNVIPSLIKRGAGKLCSKECRNKRKSELSSGPNNPNWIDGNNKLHKRLIEQKRRSIKKICQVGKFNKDDWEEIKKKYGYSCPSCKKQEPEIMLTIDHIIPLEQFGEHGKENIQPLCRSCNAKKRTKIIYFDPCGNGIEVFDKLSLISAVGEGLLPVEFVKANMPNLNRQAISLKGNMRIPGVRAVSESKMVPTGR